MFNLTFISHFYAVVVCIIQTFQPKYAMQDAMRSLLQHELRSLSSKFYEKLHYLLDSWMITTLPAPN